MAYPQTKIEKVLSQQLRASSKIIRHARKTHRRRDTANQRMIDAFNGSESHKVALSLFVEVPSCGRLTALQIDRIIESIHSISGVTNLSVVCNLLSIVNEIVETDLCSSYDIPLDEQCDVCKSLHRLRVATDMMWRRLSGQYHKYCDILRKAIFADSEVIKKHLSIASDPTLDELIDIAMAVREEAFAYVDRAIEALQNEVGVYC
jgi:hypothetical protein